MQNSLKTNQYKQKCAREEINYESVMPNIFEYTFNESAAARACYLCNNFANFPFKHRAIHKPVRRKSGKRQLKLEFKRNWYDRVRARLNTRRGCELCMRIGKDKAWVSGVFLPCRVHVPAAKAKHSRVLTIYTFNLERARAAKESCEKLHRIRLPPSRARVLCRVYRESRKSEEWKSLQEKN